MFRFPILCGRSRSWQIQRLSPAKPPTTDRCRDTLALAMLFHPRNIRSGLSEVNISSATMQKGQQW